MNTSLQHTFHIPVMGTGFSIDTPVKVATYGISSVISLVDDMLIEKMRKYYCAKLGIHFREISDKQYDFRAKRITAYLNLIDRIVKEKFEALKNAALEKGTEFRKYMDMLPDHSSLKQEYLGLLKDPGHLGDLKKWIGDNLLPGSIDVNIMTKLDKTNYNRQKEALPSEYNDAHAALRGYANSNLNSSVIFSAGMNPGLYGYMENFEAFYPDENGRFKKKIILKVNDYRSALIQGKFLAKKGLWVSEYRIESGLNCGGHAFATDGQLMGPVLEEFKANKDELAQTTYAILVAALKEKQRPFPKQPSLHITAQGGVGTAAEHHLLLNHYQLESVGWGSPFLLVSEAVNLDLKTAGLLCKATEEDLYLSNTSPLGIPFNTLKGNTQDLEKQRLINKGRPGSSCPKKFLVSDNIYTEKPVCTASRQYQHARLQDLDTQWLSPEEKEIQQEKIMEKSCICVGLGNAALLKYGLADKNSDFPVSVCPGPNMAYFTRTVSLKKMIAHIYGKTDIIERDDRPHIFIKEFNMYLEHFKNKLAEANGTLTVKEERYFKSFKKNLESGLEYYKALFSDIECSWSNTITKAQQDLKDIERQLDQLDVEACFDPT